MVATSTAQDGSRPALRHLMSMNFLAAKIGAETGFRHHIIGELQRGGGGQNRIAAMGDIGERSAMDEGGRAFQRLHQVRRSASFSSAVIAPCALMSLARTGLRSRV